jgi:hypothetical protein
MKGELMIKLIGKANHVYEDNSLSVLDVSTVALESDSGLSSFVTIANEGRGNNIIINSLEQWKQLNALVLKGFSDLEG